MNSKFQTRIHVSDMLCVASQVECLAFYCLHSCTRRQMQTVNKIRGDTHVKLEPNPTPQEDGMTQVGFKLDPS